MKILITGGAGFIGSNLVRHIIETTEHSVLNVDALTYAGNPALAQRHRGTTPRYAFAQVDICDAALVEQTIQAFQPDWIMHLAAESHVDRSIDGPGAFIQTNVIGTFNLLQSARSHYEALEGDAKPNFRFLHVSTDEVYGSLGETGLFTETHSLRSTLPPTQPRKHHPTTSLRAHGRTPTDFPVLITNCSNNYGPYPVPRKTNPSRHPESAQRRRHPSIRRGHQHTGLALT